MGIVISYWVTTLSYALHRTCTIPCQVGKVSGYLHCSQELRLIVTKRGAMRHKICALLKIDFAYREGCWRGYLQTLTQYMVCLPSRGEESLFYAIGNRIQMNNRIFSE